MLEIALTNYLTVSDLKHKIEVMVAKTVKESQKIDELICQLRYQLSYMIKKVKVVLDK